MRRKEQDGNKRGNVRISSHSDTVSSLPTSPTGLIGLLRHREARPKETIQPEPDTELPPGVSLAGVSVASSGGLNKTQLATLWPGLALGLSLILIGLLSVGLWLPATTSQQPMDALALMANSDDLGKSGLNNLKRLQDNMGSGISFSKTHEMLAQGGSSSLFTEESIKRELHDPIGRSNPFDPLVRVDATGSVEEPEKRDIFLDLQYTGFIGDTHSREKLAIIRLNDPTTGASKTLLKKVGDSFLVEGEHASINDISRQGVRVMLAGQKRWLSLQPYTEAAPATPANGSSVSTVSPVIPNVSSSVNTGPMGALGNTTPSPPPATTMSEGAMLRE